MFDPIGDRNSRIVKKTIYFLMIFFLSLIWLLTACQPAEVLSPTVTNTPLPTATSTATIIPTETATPEPTATPYYDKAGKYLDVININDEPRWFMLHIPESYQHGTPTALVISYHGAGSNYEEQELISALNTKAEEAGFIAAYPQASRNSGSVWQLTDQDSTSVDIEFTRQLIDTLVDRLSIDANRVYALGFSNGGGLVDNLGCYLSNKIAAIAPVAGSYIYWAECNPSRPVPVLAFHGTADDAVPYKGGGSSIPNWAGAWAGRNGCDSQSENTSPEENVIIDTWVNCVENATVTLYTIEGGGHIWPGSPLWSNLRKLEGYPQGVVATDLIWEFYQAHPQP